MTVTLTYEPTLSRVRVDATATGVTGISSATVGDVERSTDQVTWSRVRCGTDAPIVSGVITIYDYEFAVGVTNYYRVTYTKDFSLVGVGTAAHGDNASVVPTLSAGVANDLILVWAAIRATAANVSTPAGYTLLRSLGNARLFGKVHSGSESNPTITFTGGAAGDTTSAQAAVMRNVNLSVVDGVSSVAQASAQNIAYASLITTIKRALILFLGWKQDDWTNVATLPSLAGDPAVELGEPSSTTGNDQGIVWDYIAQTGTTTVTVPTGSFIITGGGAAISSSSVLTLTRATTSQVSSIVPTITDVWLKSVSKPFLNRALTCVVNVSPIERDPRHGIFEVLNRSVPVAVTDLHQSREVTLEVVTTTRTEHRELDLIISSGDVFFIHTPVNYVVPSMYVVMNRTSALRPLRQPHCNDVDYRKFTVPLREVATPGVDVCGSTVTWQSVVNTYATWQDVLNSVPTWFSLLQTVGQPPDVLVP
jgi:hypothetical protein